MVGWFVKGGNYDGRRVCVHVGLKDGGGGREERGAAVRCMYAGKRERTRASPRSRQPQTKGTLNLFLLMWFSSSAMVSTSDSSM